MVISRPNSRLEALVKSMVVAAAALYLIASALYCIKFARVHFCDFRARYNEVHCVWSRLDPYDLYSGAKTSPVFYAWWGVVPDDPQARCVDFYPPWSYTYLSPLAVLPYTPALAVFLTLNILAFMGIAGIGAWTGYRVRGSKLDAAFVGATSLCLAKAMPLMFDAANYGLLIAFLTIVMCLLLNKKRDVLAGLVWGLMMVKIQTGPLFFIPLFFGKKYKTIAVAVLTCVLAALPTALLVGKSPVDLVLCLASRGSDMIKCSVLSGLFSPFLTNPQMTAAQAALGIGVCALSSWLLRKQADWLAKFVPPAICCVLWTYSQCQDQVMFAIPLMCLSTLIVSEAAPWKRIAAAACILCLWYTYYEAVLDFFDRFFTWPPDAKRFIQQIRSTGGSLAGLSWYAIALVLPFLLPQPQEQPHEP